MASNKDQRKTGVANTGPIQYVISESGPPNRTIIFESEATTDDGIMRTAHKALVGQFPAETDQMVNGYTVFRSTPIGFYTPQLPDDTAEPEEIPGIEKPQDNP